MVLDPEPNWRKREYAMNLLAHYAAEIEVCQDMIDRIGEESRWSWTWQRQRANAIRAWNDQNAIAWQRGYYGVEDEGDA